MSQFCYLFAFLSFYMTFLIMFPAETWIVCLKSNGSKIETHNDQMLLHLKGLQEVTERLLKVMRKGYIRTLSAIYLCVTGVLLFSALYISLFSKSALSNHMSLFSFTAIKHCSCNKLTCGISGLAYLS